MDREATRNTLDPMPRRAVAVHNPETVQAVRPASLLTYEFKLQFLQLIR